jgi:hypothetical protein
MGRDCPARLAIVILFVGSRSTKIRAQLCRFDHPTHLGELELGLKRFADLRPTWPPAWFQSGTSS